MNPWIKLEVAFYRHRKTLRLKRAIGRAAYWVPPRLWAYCVENETGDLSKLDDIDLATVLDYDEDVAKLREALVDAGFLSSDGGRVRGWDERYAAQLQFYRDRATKAAAARWGHSIPSSDSSPESGEREREGDGIREDKRRKHRDASKKDATSIENKRPEQIRAEKLFRRRETTPWDPGERKAWDMNKAVILATTPEQWTLLEWFYGLPASEKTYRRHDLATLLRNWNSELSRAADYQAQHKGGLDPKFDRF
jgi:hypothetical protein